MGLLKRDFLSAELGPAVLDLQHGIKAVLDPRNLMNPGKAI